MTSNDRIAVRKLQALQGKKSFTIVLAKEFVSRLGLEKGDFLKSYIDGDRLIFQKAEI